jgi:hypothetical protein
MQSNIQSSLKTKGTNGQYDTLDNDLSKWEVEAHTAFGEKISISRSLKIRYW